MRTVVRGPMPPELAALIDRRRRTGADLYDEVWSGEYHMAPAPHSAHGLVDNELAVLLAPLARAAGLTGSGPFNLGRADDYRVPDRGLHRAAPSSAFVATAALVVEVVSPDDETWAKLPFYAAHRVDELLIADPIDRSVSLLQLSQQTHDDAPPTYTAVYRSGLLDVTADELRAAIAWPTIA